MRCGLGLWHLAFVLILSKNQSSFPLLSFVQNSRVACPGKVLIGKRNYLTENCIRAPMKRVRPDYSAVPPWILAAFNSSAMLGTTMTSNVNLREYEKDSWNRKPFGPAHRLLT